MLTKKRTLVLNGMTFDIFIKGNSVVKTEMFGYTFKGSDNIKFNQDFIEYLTSRPKDLIVNMDNPVLHKDKTLGGVFKKQIENIENEMSAAFKLFEYKKDKKATLKLLESGMIRKEDLPGAIKLLNRPTGLKGIFYNITKKAATFASKLTKKFRGEVFNQNDFKKIYDLEVDEDDNIVSSESSDLDRSDTSNEAKNVDKESPDDALQKLSISLIEKIEILTAEISNLKKEQEDLKKADSDSASKEKETQKKFEPKTKASTQSKTSDENSLKGTMEKCRANFKKFSSNVQKLTKEDYKNLGDLHNKLQSMVDNGKMDEKSAIDNLKEYGKNILIQKKEMMQQEAKEPQKSFAPQNKDEQKLIEAAGSNEDINDALDMVQNDSVVQSFYEYSTKNYETIPENENQTEEIVNAFNAENQKIQTPNVS